MLSRKQPIGDKEESGFNSRERVWLCLTSLWHRRFVEDVVHIVCAPKGTRIRVRYRNDYVEEGLWQRVRKGMPLGNVVVLVALLDARKTSPLQASPLRRCRLVGARCHGSIIALDLAVDDYLIPSSSRDAFWKEVVKEGANLPETRAPAQAPSGHFLQELAAPPTSVLRGSTIDAWESVAAAVFSIDNAGCRSGAQPLIPFMYAIVARDSEVTRSLAHRGRVVREGGLSFSLDVHTITRSSAGKIVNPLGEVCMEISNPAAKFITSRRVRIDSQRDVKTIEVSTSAVFRSAHGHLSVRCVFFEYPTIGAGEPTGGNLTIEGAAAQATRTPGLDAAMKAANLREEVVVARYDFSLVVGRILPWIACALVALAAATTTFEVPNDRAVNAFDFLQSTVVFLLSFVGLVIGLRGEKE